MKLSSLHCNNTSSTAAITRGTEGVGCFVGSMPDLQMSGSSLIQMCGWGPGPYQLTYLITFLHDHVTSGLCHVGDDVSQCFSSAASHYSLNVALTSSIRRHSKSSDLCQDNHCYTRWKTSHHVIHTSPQYYFCAVSISLNFMKLIRKTT